MLERPSLRISYFIALMISAALLLFSIYLQFNAGFKPCALCVLQRGALILLAIIFLAGALFKVKGFGQFMIGTMASLIALLGVILSGRQTWVQHMPDNVNQACGASLQYMLKVLPFDQVVQKILQGSPECTEKGWMFMSLSLAEWSLGCFVLFLLFSIWQTTRKSP